MMSMSDVRCLLMESSAIIGKEADSIRGHLQDIKEQVSHLRAFYEDEELQQRTDQAISTVMCMEKALEELFGFSDELKTEYFSRWTPIVYGPDPSETGGSGLPIDAIS